MIKTDQGFLINKLKYNENSIIADFYTRENGRAVLDCEADAMLARV